MRPARWFVRLVLLVLVAAAVPHLREVDAQVFTPRAILAGHKSAVVYLCFSADSTLLATSGGLDGTVKLWDVATGHERATIKTGGNNVHEITFTPEGSVLAIVGGVKVHEIASTPERSVLAIVDRSRKTRGRGETTRTDLKVLDPDPAKARTLSIEGHEIHSIAYSPDGKTLAVGTEVRLALLDAPTGRVRATLIEGNPIALQVAFSRDGATLASVGWNGRNIRLWDVATGKELAILHDHADQPHNARVNAPAFSPNGKYLASGSDDNTARVWYLSSLDPIVALKGPRGGVDSVAYSPDGKLLAAGCRDKSLMLWDAETFVERAKIRAHDSAVCWVAFSPDGKFLATGGRDRLAKIWEVSHLLGGGSPVPAPPPTGVKPGSGDRKQVRGANAKDESSF